jgi:hypothetical protein
MKRLVYVLIPLVISAFFVMPTPGHVKADKCVSGRSGSSEGTACVRDHPKIDNDVKKGCRESGAKCSSSQTGNGEFGNFFKEHGHVVPKS